MARIRSIHPGLASDEAYMSMSMTAKAAWPVLWTECDDHGVFEWKPIVLKARIFPADNLDFAAVLEEYERLECVKRLKIDGKQYGYIRNFCKFQRPKNPSYRFTLPECMRVFVAYSATPTPAVPEDTPTAPEKPPQMKEVVGEKEDKKENSRAVADATRSGVKSTFDEFWKEYPRRDGANPKAPSFKKFRAAIASGVDPAVIVAGAKRYAAEMRAKGQERTPYVAQAMTWLGQQRWGDYGEPEPECAASAPDLYFKQDTPQFIAWESHMRATTGKGLIMGRGGGWLAPAEWPPGYDPPKNNAPATPAINMRPM